jgi:uncharacterized FlaG/YvyC family protein
MAAEEISDTGRFSTIDPAASYSTSSTGSYPSLGSGPVPQPAAMQATALPRIASSVASTAPATSTRPATTAEIQSAVSAANANLAASNRELDYRVDAATGISFALIRNSQTGVVVQQIPGADIIALARMLADWSPGKHMMLDLIA